MAAAPFLSICILTYNRSRTLAKALDSILPQVTDDPGVEVVISDNASTDDTGEVGRRYEQTWPRLRYTRNDTNLQFDGNVAACLRKAAGEYVHFFSDDDLVSDGLFPRLLQELREIRPVISYVTHRPFLNDDPAQTMTPLDGRHRVTNDGAEYLLEHGLGFISALTVRREEACRFIDRIVPGRGTAHLDIALRVALTTPGPFLFDGTLAILSKYDYGCHYDILRYGPMNVTAVHEELCREGLLTPRDLAAQKHRTIPTLPRSIVNNRLRGKGIVSAHELRRIYGGDPLFYLVAYPLALVPISLVQAIGFPARQLMRWYRHTRVERSVASRD